jgi:hypothetical protein
MRASLVLVLILVVSLVAGSVLAAPPRSPVPTALYVLFLDERGLQEQAQSAGLRLYGRLPSLRGEYLLLGATPAEAARTGLPLQLLDADTSEGAYYLAFPPSGRKPASSAALNWASYGRVLLELGDQVLLRSTPAQAERLPDSRVDIVRIDLKPLPWPVETEDLAADLAITPDPAVQAMLDQVSSSTITTYTSQLSGLQEVTVGGAPYTITSRYTYSVTPIQKAGQFVGEHLQALGMGVEYHVWGTSGTPATYPNVIGQITGSTNPGDVYIIGAHLDDMPSSGLAPGADDNGSGSVGTMIAADILSQYQWSCTLRFAFWTGEEQGLLGSKAYALRSKGQGENIKGYLNMDMIAYNGSAPNEIDLFANSSVPGSVSMMNLYADAVAAYGLNLVPTLYTNDTLGTRSDNKSFWDQGFASVLAIEDYYGDFTPYYHTANDKLSTLNMAYYTDFVKASLATFVHLTGCLVTGPAPTDTPTLTNTPLPTDTPTFTPTPTDTATPTNTPLPTDTPTFTPTPTDTSTPTNTPLPTDTPTFTPTPTDTSTPTFTATFSPTPTFSATPSSTAVPGPWLYLGSSTSGTAGGIAFADEDILIRKQATGAWSLFFDGSDVGLANTDVDAFELQADGTLLVSFDSAFTLSGFGAVDDSDILRFTPTSTGSNTAGAWTWYFDGSDVGLTTNDEDIDAFTVTADGRILISTLGDVSVTGAVSGMDEDLLVFTPTTLGTTTSGTWAQHFDGSDVGLSNTSNEDVNGVWVDTAGKLYLTTLGNFSVSGASGDGSDIFVCTPGTLGSTTTCTWSLYWDGSVNGFSGEDTDSLSILP